ncbi:MAG: family virulence protein [Rhodospirillales bacterium]|jgi:glyoxylase I family protein|nr:family virulence protein [Rhodospirillales bacterium]
MAVIVATGLDHVVLRVADLDRAMHFYRDILGCPVDKIQADLGLWQLRAGSALIDLIPLDGRLGSAGGAGPGAEGHNLDHFCLRLASWDEKALREHLAAHGIAIVESGPRYGAEGTGPSIYVKDPDGTTVELKAPIG